MYNYLESMKSDITTYLEENFEYKYLGQVEDLEELEEKLNEDLWTEDVGNWFLSEKWEAMDVTIRCHLLGSTISEVLEENADEFEKAISEALEEI